MLVFSIKENGIRLILLRKACKSVLKFAVMMFIYDDRPEPFSICTFVLLFSPYATSTNAMKEFILVPNHALTITNAIVGS
jgi:hypothetical protein